MTPRLSELNPDDVAFEACDLVATYVAGLVRGAGFVPRVKAPKGSALWNKFRALTVWAQTGEGLLREDPVRFDKASRPRRRHAHRAASETSGDRR